MAQWNISDYQTVAERIEIFWNIYPEGRIFNDIVLTNEKEVIIKCSVWKDRNTQLPDATDFAQEFITEKGINSTAAVEVCSTSATGRALSLLGGALSSSKSRASATEMDKRKRSLFPLAQAAFEKGDIEHLRQLLLEAKDLKAEPVVISKITEMGKELANKNTPAEKEQTAEVQA